MSILNSQQKHEIKPKNDWDGLRAKCTLQSPVPLLQTTHPLSPRRKAVQLWDKSILQTTHPLSPRRKAVHLLYKIIIRTRELDKWVGDKKERKRARPCWILLSCFLGLLIFFLLALDSFGLWLDTGSSSSLRWEADFESIVNEIMQDLLRVNAVTCAAKFEIWCVRAYLQQYYWGAEDQEEQEYEQDEDESTMSGRALEQAEVIKKCGEIVM